MENLQKCQILNSSFSVLLLYFCLKTRSKNRGEIYKFILIFCKLSIFLVSSLIAVFLIQKAPTNYIKQRAQNIQSHHIPQTNFCAQIRQSSSRTSAVLHDSPYNSQIMRFKAKISQGREAAGGAGQATCVLSQKHCLTKFKVRARERERERHREREKRRGGESGEQKDDRVGARAVQERRGGT
jgi:hypothetical protein